MKRIIIPLLALMLFSASCSNRNSARESSTTTETTDTKEATPSPAAADEAPATESREPHEYQQARKLAGQITAGEWKDAAHWDFWESLMQQDIYGDMKNTWSFNLDNRITVKTVTSSGAPAADVPVKLRSADGEILWGGRTNNKGIADLFPRLKDKQNNEQELKITTEDAERKVSSKNEGILKITVPQNIEKPLLDAAFVVDATGSMGDEMDYLKAELTDVIHQVAGHNSGLEIHTGAVFYRDEGDDFLTRKSDFTEDISETVSFIRKQEADGGGDFPEAVHTALDVALNDMEWSDEARARLLFLVLDAPPHNDPEIIRKVNKLVALASKKGVRIIPVVSSGINKETEFLMRYMAIATGGTYVFLTDDSGIGNSHLQPTVGKYEVEYLNALLVRVIDSYVSNNRGQ